MRAVFGLVSLLVVIAIIVIVFKTVSVPTIKTGEQAHSQAEQQSGRGQNGIPAMETFKTEGKFRGRTLEGLVVTDVTPNEAMANYGLQKGDEIISVNGDKLTAISNDDPELAKAWVVQHGFEGNNSIVVLRNGQEISLPNRGNPSNGIPANSAASQPNAPKPQDNSLQGQLNNINQQIKIPSH